MKKNILVGITMLLALTLVTGCGCTKKDNKKKEEIKTNTNEEVIKDQELEEFKFENTSLVYMDNTSILETKVTNTSGNTASLQEFKIHVRDKEGNEIVELTGYIGSTLEPGESKTITSSYGEDLTKAASIDYEVIR